MPELPEVETTCRGIRPLVVGRRIDAVIVREPRLRWPVPKNIAQTLAGRTIESVGRRAKYLLIDTGSGTLIVHLGMSGSLRVSPADADPGPYDHFELQFDDGSALRLRDPRRFGSVHFTREAPDDHPLLRDLGPEPFDPAFDGAWLHACALGRRVAVKNLIMDSHVVAGVGNIYASEALFLSGIDPRRAAGRIAAARYADLAHAVRDVLGEAIAAGGTTLRDFAAADGSPGYFRIRLNVYDRAGEPCPECGAPIREQRIGQRSSFFCAHCQH
ncbi:MAG: bifunctional DNA-formamidopyrimidine glycosylase/DNA-(apurinic or apyrimidinic site) lyase [Chromatiales bacterium]|nr:bifunctional DNA-formamidopyrimidine glycosylase/DNA-(apurinic or apyrimidinic site) lyase [Chromatiales bacterium]